MRLELLASALAFGASSIYWLITAGCVDAAQYGGIMQLQALLLLCTGLLSCRTYDLVFFLRKQFSWGIRRAFLLTLGIEAGLFLCSTVLATVFLRLQPTLVPLAGPALSGPETWLAVALASCVIFQGSSQALLRSLHQDRAVARCDLLSGLAFLAAAAAVMFSLLSDILLAWLLAQALRPLALCVSALAHRPPADPPAAAGAAVGHGVIASFLLKGQLTNLVKNNLIAIETLLLGRISGSESVALYRIARALLNFSTVFLNITYQKAFRELTDAGAGEARLLVLSRINRQSLQLWLIALPVCLAAAAAFPVISPDVAYGGLLPVTALMAVSLLPTVFQQSEFAWLSLEGRFTRITLAYGGGLLLLVAGGLLLSAPAPLEAFLGCLLAANLGRYLLMRTGKPRPT